MYKYGQEGSLYPSWYGRTQKKSKKLQRTSDYWIVLPFVMNLQKTAKKARTGRYGRTQDARIHKCFVQPEGL